MVLLDFSLHGNPPHDEGILNNAIHVEIEKEISEQFPPPAPPKCSIRRFERVNCELYWCAAIDWQMMIHKICYQYVTPFNANMELLLPGKVVCIQTCYTKYMIKLKKQTDRESGMVNHPWDHDEKLGMRDP